MSICSVFIYEQFWVSTKYGDFITIIIIISWPAKKWQNWKQIYEYIRKIYNNQERYISGEISTTALKHNHTPYIHYPSSQLLAMRWRGVFKTWNYRAAIIVIFFYATIESLLRIMSETNFYFICSFHA